VAPFADPAVGGVAGNQCYTTQSGNATNAGEHLYWNFDRKLKQSQSQAGNTISATGAIYAIRRTLFRTVPTGVTDDFVTSTSVIAQGYRLVFAPDAIAYEPVAASSGMEFGRKVRVITRGLRGVLIMRELLNPFHYGFYAVQLMSHKVLRRTAVFPLLMVFALSPLLWGHGLFYQIAAVLQVTFYGCALAGLVLARTSRARARRLNRLVTLPFFFCMTNAAAFLAVLNLVRGHRIDFWEPQRQGQPDLSLPNDEFASQASPAPSGAGTN
jgi:cellulose synthase/poly-beta-1,6-N-acetylglucosamine synthase-like glycosyltransferase